MKCNCNLCGTVYNTCMKSVCYKCNNTDSPIGCLVLVLFIVGIVIAINVWVPAGEAWASFRVWGNWLLSCGGTC